MPASCMNQRITATTPEWRAGNDDDEKVKMRTQEPLQTPEAAVLSRFFDRTAQKLLRDQQSIFQQLRHALLAAPSKDISSIKKYMVLRRRGRQYSKEHNEDGRVWEDLKKASKVISEFPELQLRFRNSQNTEILENVIFTLQACLQSLQVNLGSKTHQSFTRRLFSKALPLEQWLYRIDNARGCACLLLDSINISRFIDEVSVGTERITSIGQLNNNMETVNRRDPFDISDQPSVKADPAVSVASSDSDRSFSQQYSIGCYVEEVAELKTQRTRSNSDQAMKAIGSWVEDELHPSHVPRAKTWPTLDEYYPTSSYQIPPSTTQFTTLPSEIMAGPRIKTP